MVNAPRGRIWFGFEAKGQHKRIGVRRTENNALNTLLGEIAACRICRDQPRFLPGLPHEPRPVVQVGPTAPILIAGQAPGTKVHATGIPFNDPSGDRLRTWLDVEREVFYDPESFALLPMGFCFPGQDTRGADLPPRRECAPRWRDRLLANLPHVKLILVIGQYAHAYHLGDRRRGSLTDTVRDFAAIFDGSTPRVLPMPHPSWRNTAWLKRNPWFERDLLPVLRREVARCLG